MRVSIRKSVMFTKGDIAMNSSKYIGRVGGLAVALGLGAAAYNGAGVALADNPSSGSGSPSHANKAPSADTASPKQNSTGAFRSSRPTTRAAARESAPSTTSLVKPAADAALARSAGAATTTTAPEVPVGPNDAALDAALLAYARRETATFAPSAAAIAPSVAASHLEALPAEATGHNIALIMGGSGTPIPSADYIQNVFNLYVAANSPDGTIPEQLVTPEGLYPITGVKSLPLNISVDQGNQIVYDEVLKQIAAGNTVTIFGYSQSAIINSLIMRPDNTGCVNTSTCSLPEDAPVNFVLVGNEMNPNGGFLSRFPGLNLPSLGIEFYGPTPEDSFPVANYMLEYDGFADFPRYPLNALASFNAVMGIAFVHGNYPNLTQEQVDSAIALPTTSDTQSYYVIQTADLPMLDPLRLIPLIGNPIADLLQPALRVIVNIGYGDPKYGWSTGYGNVETPFGFINDVDWGECIELFFDGVAQGITDFVADISPGGIMTQELKAIGSSINDSANSLVSLFSLSPANFIATVQTAVTEAVYFVSNAVASIYSALLPTADIVDALVTMLPVYAFDLFLEGIEQALSGDVINGLINVVGRPWAAAVGLVTTAIGIEALVIAGALEGVFTGVIQ